MNGAERIAQERRWQVESEGWTPEHDDEHSGGELVDAARAYAIAARVSPDFARALVANGDLVWPWDPSWWKPTDDPIRNLEKAGALIAAEIDRLLRARGAAIERRLLTIDELASFVHSPHRVGMLPVGAPVVVSNGVDDREVTGVEVRDGRLVLILGRVH